LRAAAPDYICRGEPLLRARRSVLASARRLTPHANPPTPWRGPPTPERAAVPHAPLQQRHSPPLLARSHAAAPGRPRHCPAQRALRRCPLPRSRARRRRQGGGHPAHRLAHAAELPLERRARRAVQGARAFGNGHIRHRLHGGRQGVRRPRGHQEAAQVPPRPHAAAGPAQRDRYAAAAAGRAQCGAPARRLRVRRRLLLRGGAVLRRRRADAAGGGGRAAGGGRGQGDAGHPSGAGPSMAAQAVLRLQGGAVCVARGRCLQAPQLAHTSPTAACSLQLPARSSSRTPTRATSPWAT
jgi:hypothetical protein